MGEGCGGIGEKGRSFVRHREEKKTGREQKSLIIEKMTEEVRRRESV